MVSVARFEVTSSSIRRDLALLNGQGRPARSYGGAMVLGAHPEASLRSTGEAFEQKHAIARGPSVPRDQHPPGTGRVRRY